VLRRNELRAQLQTCGTRVLELTAQENDQAKQMRQMLEGRKMLEGDMGRLWSEVHGSQARFTGNMSIQNMVRAVIGGYVRASVRASGVYMYDYIFRDHMHVFWIRCLT